MNFVDYLNEGYSKELSKQLKAYGLSKKVGDWLADHGVSVNDAKTRTDLDKIIKDKPLGITSAIKEIKNQYLNDFNGGYLIFVHDTEGVTLIKTVKSGFKDVNLNKDNRMEFGDTDGKIVSVYVIEASHDDFNSWSGSATSKKQYSRRDNGSGEDSTEIMKNQRDYAIKKRDDLNNALKNKTIKKIYDLLTNAGFEIKRVEQLPFVEVISNNVCLHDVSLQIEQKYGPNISFYVSSNFEQSYKLDSNIKTKVSINVSSSEFNYFANDIDEVTNEYSKVAEVSKAISKVSEILKKSTYRDLLV